MFQIAQLCAGYARHSEVVKDISLTIAEGEIFCLLGRNGAGKTTLLRAIMGLLPHRRGAIDLAGQRLSALPAHAVSGHGIGYVPQGRRLFTALTVRENLQLVCLGRREPVDWADIFALFPVLRQRLDQNAGTLSGGEQQMLAMARALCVQPKLLLLDEPTEGLMPSMIAIIRNAITDTAASGAAVLLVEQRIDAVIHIAHRVGFVANGRLQDILPADQIGPGNALVKHHLGV